MITHATYISGITIRASSNDGFDQDEALSVLIRRINNNPSYQIEQQNIGENETDYTEYLIYSNFTLIGSISTEMILNIENSSEYIDVLTLTFDKLKTYHDITDNSSFMCLLESCMVLNQHGIDFKLTEIDICLDGVCEQDHTIGMKIKDIPIYNTTNFYNMAKITNVSRIFFNNDIRRLKFKVKIEEFNHMNANIHVFKEITALYDFFYYDYEEEIIRLGIYLEDAEGELKKKEALSLDIDAIESFVGRLFFYGHNP